MLGGCASLPVIPELKTGTRNSQDKLSNHSSPFCKFWVQLRDPASKNSESYLGRLLMPASKCRNTHICNHTNSNVHAHKPAYHTRIYLVSPLTHTSHKEYRTQPREEGHDRSCRKQVSCHVEKITHAVCPKHVQHEPAGSLKAWPRASQPGASWFHSLRLPG